MNPTMNLEESGKYLNISGETMRNLADSGTIPGAKVGKGWVFRTKDLDYYLDDVISKQTDERREARIMGQRVRVKTEATVVRETATRSNRPRRRNHPVLPCLPA